MFSRSVNFFVLGVFLLCESDAWWLVGKNGNSGNCPARGGASPYYFGTTNLWCMNKGRRGIPTRGVWELTHRFIYYKGLYFEFSSDSKAHVSPNRLLGYKCSGGRESSPAGYSEVDVECLKGCARNYRCTFGSYNLLSNNCHKFANRLSEVMCKRGSGCPRWCLGSCNDAYISG
ncbi:uncharacterized protein LOC134282015 [Saccostrea cucullata]|uniref:uncharacterized protein LOC134269141 n=1 Tax=Saccostrea cuccullata TaxID=36930 RepID=UPI002ED1481C